MHFSSFNLFISPCLPASRWVLLAGRASASPQPWIFWMWFILASSAKDWLFGSASELLIFTSVCCVQNVKGGGWGAPQRSHGMPWGRWPPCLLAGNAPCSSPLSRADPRGFYVLPEVAENTSLVLRNCRVRGGKPLTERAPPHPLCAPKPMLLLQGPRRVLVLRVGFFWHLHPECRG